MLVLKSEIKIGGFVLDFVNEIDISSSVDELTSGGTLTIPKNIVFKKDNQVIKDVVGGEAPLFKRGDQIEISLGYKPNLRSYFKGFISNITPTYPIMFEIEDDMYTFKQTKVEPLNVSSTSLNDLLIKILPSGTAFEALNVELGNIRIRRSSTVAKVLEFLKDTYGLSTYINKEGLLYVGFAFTDADLVTEDATIFEFGKNIIDDSKLIYQKEEDQEIEMNATSIFPDNTKIEVKLGDEGGEQRSFFQYNVNEADLRKLAQEQLNKLKYTGFKGEFETFLEPQVKKGDSIQMINSSFPEKDGYYLIRSVRYTFGQSGGRQLIELEKRIS